MSERKPFLKSAGIVSAITLFSRCLGLVRDMVLAACFGASRTGDIFLIAFELPNLARRILGEGSLSAFIVPVFSRVRKAEGEDGGWRFASNALTTLGLFSLVLTALGILAAPWLFSIFGYGYVERGDIEAIRMGAQLTRIMFPFLMLLAISSILMGMCHSLRHFTTPALGSVMLNVSMIATGLIFWRTASSGDPGSWTFAQWLAVSVLVGAALRVIIMLPPLYKAGFRYSLRLHPGSGRMRRLYAMMLPALYGLAVVQINISVSRAFATWLGEGYVPCLVFSNRLVQLPLAIIAASMATAILPQISQYWIDGQKAELSRLARFAFRLVLILFMPAMAGLIVLGIPIIQLLFERNQWDAQGTADTYVALAFYAPGLAAWGMLRILTPIYYAQQDVRTPVLTATVAMVVNIALNVLLVGVAPLRETLGHGGLALATTLSVFLNTFLLFTILQKRRIGLWDMGLTITAIKTTAAAAIMGLCGWYIWPRLDAAIPELLAARIVALGGLIALLAAFYFVLCFMLRVRDLSGAKNILLRKKRTGR
ncbi:MAG: murein biosynthesis integral membrane protein MurJ [Candidatus Sumerlaeia bacterium]